MELWQFVIQATIVVVGVIVVSWIVAGRMQVGALVWFVGALTFIASQVPRIPLLTGLEMAGVPALLLGTVAVFTAGFCEEGARYIAFRWGLKRRRRAQDGAVFGLGHGGIEAIIVGGLFVVNAFVLLTAGDQIVEAVTEVGPEGVAEVESAIADLEDATVAEAAVGVYERVLAIVSHVAMTLMVLRSVCRRQLRWLSVAMTYHMALNAVTVVLLDAYGIFAGETALTIMTVLSGYIIYTAWNHRAEWFGTADRYSGGGSEAQSTP